jgi:hypothetical protein
MAGSPDHSKKGEIYGDPTLGKLMSAATGYAYNPDGIGYPTSGDLQAWCAAHGIAAVDIELSDHDSIEWERNWQGLLAFVASAWDAPTPETTREPE